MNAAENLNNPIQSVPKQVVKKVVQEDISKKKDVIEFDWKNKWLKGNINSGHLV